MAITQTGFREPTVDATLTYPSALQGVPTSTLTALAGGESGNTNLTLGDVFFLKGFDLSDIPPDATIKKVQCRITRKATNGIDIPTTISNWQNSNEFGRIKVDLGFNESIAGTSDNGFTFDNPNNSPAGAGLAPLNIAFSNSEFKTVIHDIDFPFLQTVLTDTSHYLIPNNVFVKIEIVGTGIELGGATGSPVVINNGDNSTSNSTNEVQIALNVVYSTGTKLKISGTSSIISGRPKTFINTPALFDDNGFQWTINNYPLITPHTGTVSFNDAANEGFFASATKLFLTTLSNGTDFFSPVQIIPSNATIDYVKVTIAYNFQTINSDGSNSFKAGFTTNNASGDINDFDPQGGELTILNNPNNQGNNIATQTFTLQGSDLNTLVPTNNSIVFLMFTLLYTDDNPDNTLRVFGLNDTSVVAAGITQVSPLVEISYNGGFIPTKVKISDSTLFNGIGTKVLLK